MSVAPTPTEPDTPRDSGEPLTALRRGVSCTSVGSSYPEAGDGPFVVPGLGTPAGHAGGAHGSQRVGPEARPARSPLASARARPLPSRLAVPGRGVSVPAARARHRLRPAAQPPARAFARPHRAARGGWAPDRTVEPAARALRLQRRAPASTQDPACAPLAGRPDGWLGRADAPVSRCRPLAFAQVSGLDSFGLRSRATRALRPIFLSTDLPRWCPTGMRKGGL